MNLNRFSFTPSPLVVWAWVVAHPAYRGGMVSLGGPGWYYSPTGVSKCHLKFIYTSLLVVRTVYVRCSYGVRTVLARCSYDARALSVRCSRVVRALFACCSRVVRALFVYFEPRTRTTERARLILTEGFDLIEFSLRHRPKGFSKWAVLNSRDCALGAH